MIIALFAGNRETGSIFLANARKPGPRKIKQALEYEQHPIRRKGYTLWHGFEFFHARRAKPFLAFFLHVHAFFDVDIHTTAMEELLAQGTIDHVL